MNRYWHLWMAVAVTVAMISPAAAQNDIGSYQSILARAGYPSNVDGYGDDGAYSTPQQPVPVPPSMSMQPFGSGQPAIAKPMMPTQPASSPLRQPAYGAYGGSMQDSVPPSADIVGSAENVVEAGPVTSGESASGDEGIATSLGAPCYGDCISSFIDGGCDYSADPVYGPRRSSADSNIVVGLRGLIIARDYEHHQLLSCNPAGGTLFSTDADHNSMGGFDFSLQNRKSSGRGWEFRYWGLYPDTAVATLTGSPVYTHLRGLDQVDHLGNTVFDIYGQGDEHNVVRNTSINNIEFNVMRNGGQYQTIRGRQADYELLAGFRWFQFDEDLSYVSDTTFGGYPPTMTYLSEVTNALLGFQLGGRTEFCLSQRWRFNAASKVGIFNNFVTANQSIFDQGGAFSTVNGGTDYNFQDDKNDVSVLGEMDFGLSFMLSPKSRVTIGYRAIGVAGVALSTDQIPDDFTAVDQILRTNSNSSLLMNGGYAGLEFCY